MQALVVDDEPNIRMMIRMTLETAGYSVEEAGDGADALNRYGDGARWDVVVLDHKMPGMEGTEVLRHIKERNPEAAVVIVTAHASIDLVIDALRLGASDFLRKPMSPDALRGAVAGAIQSRNTAKPAPVNAEPPIQTLTMNGFRIVTPAASEAPAVFGNEHHFTVMRFPNREHHDVVVAIDGEAIARVKRLTGRELPASSAYWRGHAEKLLSGYLWAEGKLPPYGRLTVTDVSRDDLESAARWSET